MHLQCNRNAFAYLHNCMLYCETLIFFNILHCSWEVIWIAKLLSITIKHGLIVVLK